MAEAPPPPSGTPTIDRRRYRRVRRFFAEAFLHVIFWDLLMNRPLLRRFRPPAPDRWRGLARRFRVLAVEMGGVLIKLGQFLSIRVDILPPEVTSELSGLQDEVPAEPLKRIVGRIEAAFGRPAGQLFAEISTEPLGAASLAQVHAVRLHSGEPAVVKVLRPGIETLVETDLSAITLAFGWLKWYRRVRKRVDLDWLTSEFSAVTRKELDLRAEARNIERFAADFAGDWQVLTPKIYWDYTTTRVLTLENVGYIRIADIAAIRAAGIDPARVADKLHDIYMRQVFETYFVHVDPHPGNLFVRPLPESADDDGRSFQLVLVDFGMAVEIPERLRSALREYAIGVGTRDAARIVQSMADAGTLLKDADLQRLEEAHEAIFNRMWGIRVGRFKDMAMEEAKFFLREYRDVIYDAPFQFQADMLFVVRAIGILSGMAANLDPDFDPWAKTIPYAERFAAEELRRNRKRWREELVELGLASFHLPRRLDETLRSLQQGRTTVQIRLAPETRRDVNRLETAVRRLGWMVTAAALLGSGVYLHIAAPEGAADMLLLGLAAIAFIWGLRKG